MGGGVRRQPGELPRSSRHRSAHDPRRQRRQRTRTRCGEAVRGQMGKSRARSHLVHAARYWLRLQRRGATMKDDYIDIEDVASEEHIRPDSAMPEDDVGVGDDFGANGGAKEQHAKGDGERARARHDALPFIDMSRWDDEPAPEREWAVDNRIPLKQPYLFTGHGAVGKSLVELQRACAHVLDRYWLGMKVKSGPVIYLGAEDDADELHRRLADILAHYGATFADLIGKLHLLSYAGDDCLLAQPDAGGLIRPTPLWKLVEQATLDIKPVAVMFDTLADVYAGDEIS